MERKQNKGRRGMDMLHGSIADKLFFFAMPIGLMGLFEQLFNSADVFILGRFVGKSAMAAVGNNMPVIGILVTLLMGISLGANVTIAQYLGARRDDKVERTVQTAILMSFGLPLLNGNLPLPYMTIETIEPLRVSISTSQTEPSLAPSFKFIISRSLKSCTLQTIKTPPP